MLLRNAVLLDPRAAAVRIALGKALLARGKAEEAAVEFEAAAQLRPKDAQPYYYLAQAYRKAGAVVKAAAALEQFQQRKADAPDGKVRFELAP